MSRDALLPPPPDVPLGQLSPREIGFLARAYGRHRQVASGRLFALLPFVKRYELYLEDGCLDEYEWAAKKASMSHAEVNRALNLFGKIGAYDCLWSLMVEDIGISKLERVAPHVTAENSAWLAMQVRQLTKPELEELIRQLNGKSRNGGNGRRGVEPTSQSPGASGRGTIGRAAGTGAAAAGEPGASAGTASADASSHPEESGEDCGTGAGVPGRSARDSDHPVGVGQASEPAEDTSGAGQATLFGPGIENDARRASTAPGREQPGTSLGTGSPEGPLSGWLTEADADLPDGLDAFSGAREDEAAGPPARIRCTLELDPVGDKRVRELQAMFERVHGRPIGLGELFSLLAQEAVNRGQLPTLEGRFPEGDRGSAAPMAAAAEETQAQSQAIAAPAPDAQAPRRFMPRLVEVVISIAETGWRFVRTALGWVPVAAGALGGFLSPGKPIPLANLRIAAIAASGRSTEGRYVPAAVQRYLLVRSGGYCEIGDCRRRATAAHHARRFTYDPSHHPDVLVAACEVHHGLAHNGLFRDELQDPAVWEIVETGESPCLTGADLAFQAHRSRDRTTRRADARPRGGSKARAAAAKSRPAPTRRSDASS